MVLTIKKDPSNDVCYSSLKVDEQAWQSKGYYCSRTDRFAKPAGSGSVINFLNTSSPAVEGKFYDAKPDLGRNVDKSPIRYRVLGSTSPRQVDVKAIAGNDTRYNYLKAPYAKPLGPGSYRVEVPATVPVGHINEPNRSSSSFRSLPRPVDKIKSLPDPSDTLLRDEHTWRSARGFSSPRAKRFAGNAAAMGYGGMYQLAQKYNVQAFDSFYNTDTGRYSSIERTVCESPINYSSSFRSTKPRFPPLVNECGEDIGPGKYLSQEIPSISIRNGQNNASHFLGPARFDFNRTI